MKKILILLLAFYHKFISPIFTASFGKACRFTPTCSEYTIEALNKYGFVKGIGMSIKRISRCHPLGDFGWDPVE